MEGVLPLKTGMKIGQTERTRYDHKDYTYNVHDLARAKILIHSIGNFWAEEEPFHMHVICPDDEIDQTREELVGRVDKVCLRFVQETSIVPELVDYQNVSGWYKQQVVKLAAHKVVHGDWYLTLDSDVVACKPFSSASFFRHGRLVNDWEPRTIHPLWWEFSAGILGTPVQLSAEGLKPTPVAISSVVCSKLHEFLQQEYDSRGWRPLLENLGWTEFSLYNAFMDMANIAGDYHCTRDEVRSGGLAIRSPHSFSTEKGFESWDPRLAARADSPGLFMVCNSLSRVHPKAVWKKLQGIFSSAPDYSDLSA